MDGDGGTASAGPPSLPCQNSNNSMSDGAEASHAVAQWNQLSTNHRKGAFALAINVRSAVKRWTLERTGFLTLTFGDHVVHAREAQRRLNSFLTNEARRRWAAWIIVFERMKSSRVHFHLLLPMAEDIRTGFDFEAAERGDYRSACPFLRATWAWLRRTLPGYGFGRSELLPIRKEGEAVASYVGKYIAKNIAKREENDKGVRLVRYSRGASVASLRFQFVSKGSARWRRFVEAMAAERGIEEYGELAERFGPKWAFAFMCMLPDKVVDLEACEDGHCPPQPVVIENAHGKVVYWGDTFRSRKFGPKRVDNRQPKSEVLEVTEEQRKENERIGVQNGREWSEWRLKGGWLAS